MDKKNWKKKGGVKQIWSLFRDRHTHTSPLYIDHDHDHHQLLGGDDCNSDAPAVVSSSLKDSDESKTKDKSLLKSSSSMFTVQYSVFIY